MTSKKELTRQLDYVKARLEIASNVQSARRTSSVWAEKWDKHAIKVLENELSAAQEALVGLAARLGLQDAYVHTNHKNKAVFNVADYLADVKKITAVDDTNAAWKRLGLDKEG